MLLNNEQFLTSATFKHLSNIITSSYSYSASSYSTVHVFVPNHHSIDIDDEYLKSEEHVSHMANVVSGHLCWDSLHTS